MLARSRNVLEITLSYFTLKKQEAAKSDAWKYFSLLFEKQGADSGSLTEVKYLCVCNACKRVYAYKAFDGSGFGDMQFATDYNGITYVMNALSMRVGSGRVQKRVTRGQLWVAYCGSALTAYFQSFIYGVRCARSDTACLRVNSVGWIELTSESVNS